MEKIKAEIKNILSRYALPLLYGFVVMRLILLPYLAEKSYFLYIGFGVYECLLFYVFEKIKPKKIFRGFMYIFMCILVWGICWFILNNMDINTRYSFIEWFYLDVSVVGEVMPYILMLFFALGFFIVSVIYYFTIIRFRSMGLLLVSVFPFSIYGKRSESMGAFEITLMLTVFLALLVHSRQVSDDKRKDNKGRLIVNKAYFATMALFVTFVGAVTMLLPKPEIQSQLEQNNELFNFQLIKIQKTEYDDLNNESSPRFGADSTGEEIFRLHSEIPQDVFYLRRQSFDYFENNKWVDKKNYRIDSYAPNLTSEEYKYMYDPEYIRYLTYDLLSKEEFSSYSKSAGFDPQTAKSQEQGNVITEVGETFGPAYIPAPLNTEAGNVYYVEGTNTVLPTYRGDLVSQGSRSLLNVQIDYSVETDNLYRTAEQSRLTWIDYYLLLYDAQKKGYISEALYDGIRNQKTMYTYASDCSKDLQNLAHKITDKYDTDFQKAQAIVDYFEENNYQYDLDYEPEDESIDYFLFTSKKGSCTSYATAMTLMARSVGLSARYVEGFAVSEQDEDGSYIVRDSCAHAYVEVLIPGFGWMTFDPTVPGYLESIRKAGDGFNVNGSVITTFLSYFSKIILFVAAVFIVILFVLLDRIIEFVFRIRFKFAKPKKKVVILYKRIMKLMENSSKERMKGKTPDELAEFVYYDRGADIKPVTNLFSEVVFGGKNPTEEEISEVYGIYKSNFKFMCKKTKAKYT